MTEDLDHTPADRRRQRVRDMILSAAERVLATSGADGLSIRGLAEKRAWCAVIIGSPGRSLN